VASTEGHFLQISLLCSRQKMFSFASRVIAAEILARQSWTFLQLGKRSMSVPNCMNFRSNGSTKVMLRLSTQMLPERSVHFPSPHCVHPPNLCGANFATEILSFAEITFVLQYIVPCLFQKQCFDCANPSSETSQMQKQLYGCENFSFPPSLLLVGCSAALGILVAPGSLTCYVAVAFPQKGLLSDTP